jgi:hypothetical protein
MLSGQPPRDSRMDIFPPKIAEWTANRRDMLAPLSQPRRHLGPVVQGVQILPVFPERQTHLSIQIEFFFWFTVRVMFRFCEQGDNIVATATKSPNKTSFVQDFLKDNPKGNVSAVNEAWAAAGMSGTIGATLVNKMRSDMGLTGNLRATSKPKSDTKPKSATKVVKTVSSPGKTMFVKEFLNDHHQGNVDAVNKAWEAAGFDGTISPTLVSQMRAKLGLTGNLRGMPKAGAYGKATSTGKRVGRPPKQTTAAINVQPRMSGSAPTVVLNELEADIDRLIFKAMVIGDLTEIENSLRRARRLLYGAMTGG